MPDPGDPNVCQFAPKVVLPPPESKRAILLKLLSATYTLLLIVSMSIPTGPLNCALVPNVCQFAPKVVLPSPESNLAIVSLMLSPTYILLLAVSTIILAGLLN